MGRFPTGTRPSAHRGWECCWILGRGPCSSEGLDKVSKKDPQWEDQCHPTQDNFHRELNPPGSPHTSPSPNFCGCSQPPNPISPPKSQFSKPMTGTETLEETPEVAQTLTPAGIPEKTLIFPNFLHQPTGSCSLPPWNLLQVWVGPVAVLAPNQTSQG